MAGMSSTDDLLAEVETDAGSEPPPGERDGEREADRGGLRARLSGLLSRPSLGSPVSMRGVFSLRAFLLALVLAVGGALVTGLVPFLSGALAAVVGVVVAGFGLGLLREQRAYTEVALAGAAFAGVATLLDFLLWSVVGGLGVPVTAIGFGAGVIAGVLGHYLGRDLRAGLTREL
jgi:hypothetical protein